MEQKGSNYNKKKKIKKIELTGQRKVMISEITKTEMFFSVLIYNFFSSLKSFLRKLFFCGLVES